MSDFEARYDQIEAYLKGKLSESECKVFEQEIAQSDALREEVAIQRMGFDVLEMDYIADVSQLIKKQTAQPKTRIWKWIGVGVLVSLVTLGIIVMNGSKEEHKFDRKANSSTLDTLTDTSSKVITQKNGTHLSVAPIVQQVDNSEINTIGKDKVEERTAEKKEVILLKEKVGSNDSIQPLRVVKTATIEEDSIIQKQQPTKLKTDKPECLNMPNVEVKTHEAAADTENGRLVIVNKSKEVLNYKVNDSDFNSSSVFTQLDGNKMYHVQVRDSNLCVFDIGDYKVEKSSCQSKKEYSFNMTYDANWQLSISPEQNVQISIFNKLGKVVVNRALNNENEFEWNGYYDDNQKARLGIHIVYVKSQTGKICKYNVVVSE